MQNKATTGRNRTATGLVGCQCEPWSHQPLAQGDVESFDFSCYQLCNGEAVGRPWCSQLDLYTSTWLDVVTVVMSSEGPDSCDIIGVLAQDMTLWGTGSEQHRRWRMLSISDPLFTQGLLWTWYGCPPAAFLLGWAVSEDLPTPSLLVWVVSLCYPVFWNGRAAYASPHESILSAFSERTMICRIVPTPISWKSEDTWLRGVAHNPTTRREGGGGWQEQ